MSNNKYSPKLWEAMEEIKEVFKKYDIAGQVSLHTCHVEGNTILGFTEFLNQFSPSYSCAKIETTFNDKQPFLIRVRAKKEDFGSLRKRDEALASTANMIIHLMDQAARNFMTLQSLQSQLEEVTGKFESDE